MAVLSVLASILVATASPSAREFDLAAAPDMCSTDPARAVRPDAKGVTARYVFQLPVAQAPQAEHFLSQLDSARFALGLNFQIDSTTLIFVETRIRARTAEQVRDEVATLCELGKLAKVKLALFERIDDAVLKRGARVRLREEKRRAAKAREMTDFWRSQPIERSDIDEFLKGHSEAKAEILGPDASGLRLGPVHQADCTRLKKDKYILGCKIGLPVLKDGRPEYLEFYAEFTRDSGGTMQYVPYEPDEILVIN